MRQDRDQDDTAEPPLDPAMERVQAKLRRLMLISVSTLLVGMLAVVFAVIYRASTLGGDAGAPHRAIAEIPAGSTVVDTDVDGDRLAVTVDGPDGRRVLLFELATGRPLGETAILPR